jgi:diguanylate cyclase (GGDEF)-like protein
MRRYCLIVAAFIFLSAAASAQSVVDLEKQLHTQSGGDRARTLAALTEAVRRNNPEKALDYGQQALALFAQNPDPANEVRTLNEMAAAHIALSNYSDAATFAEKARNLAIRHGNERGRARALDNLGVVAQGRGDAMAAAERFEESLAIYRALGNDRDIATAHDSLGVLYATVLGDYEGGLAYHVEALTVRERLGDKAAIAASLDNIGITYQRVGELDRALETFERALTIRREVGGDDRIANTLHNLGDVYFDKRQFERALDYHTQALELRHKYGDRSGVASSLRNIGRIHIELGNDDDARVYLNDTLPMAQSTGDDIVVAQAHLGLALLDRESGAAARAVTHARRALAIAEKLRDTELSRNAYEELAASQERAGDFAGALESFKRFHEVNDRIFAAERSRRVEVVERKSQSERRDAELAALRMQQATAALQMERQQDQRNAALVVALVVSIVAFGLYRRRVESARIAERLSVTDTLTGLKNRRYVLQTIEADTAACLRAVRTGSPDGVVTNSDLVFLMIDIDHFKAVNDQFGHEAGDHVLEQMGHVLRASCRASDTISRWGGEEFLVICRFTSRDTASTSAERVRAAVQENLFNLGGGRTLRRTCSIGFATFPFSPSHPEALKWEQVVALADDALFVAKQSGRNAWIGVFEGNALPTGLKNLPGQDDLRRWIADGTVRIESSTDAVSVAS